MKPVKNTWDAQSKKTEGVFMWSDKSCDDFEPRKTPADQPAQYFLWTAVREVLSFYNGQTKAEWYLG
jgi:hypothetical protein